MRQFLCVRCGVALQTPDDQVGRSHVCYNCNTRQVVPADAMQLPDPPSVGDNATLARTAPAHAGRMEPPLPPAYALLLATGWVLIVVGFLVAIIGIFSAMFDPGFRQSNALGGFGVGISCLVSGFITAGFGQLLHCVRHIGQNSWRQVDLTAEASSSPAHTPP